MSYYKNKSNLKQTNKCSLDNKSKEKHSIWDAIIKIFYPPKTQAATTVQRKDKGEITMANFTTKETNLLFKTIIERELGIIIADDVKELRSKTDLFENSDAISIEKISEKVDTTRVSIFRTTYMDENGDDAVAYTHTI